MGPGLRRTTREQYGSPITAPEAHVVPPLGHRRRKARGGEAARDAVALFRRRELVLAVQRWRPPPFNGRSRMLIGGARFCGIDGFRELRSASPAGYVGMRHLPNRCGYHRADNSLPSSVETAATTVLRVVCTSRPVADGTAGVDIAGEEVRLRPWRYRRRALGFQETPPARRASSPVDAVDRRRVVARDHHHRWMAATAPVRRQLRILGQNTHTRCRRRSGRRYLGEGRLRLPGAALAPPPRSRNRRSLCISVSRPFLRDRRAPETPSARAFTECVGVRLALQPTRSARVYPEPAARGASPPCRRMLSRAPHIAHAFA